MIAKIYALLWLFVILSVAGMFFTGGFNETALTIAGFAISTLAFAGIVVVLPWWIDQRYTWKGR